VSDALHRAREIVERRDGEDYVDVDDPRVTEVMRGYVDEVRVRDDAVIVINEWGLIWTIQRGNYDRLDVPDHVSAAAREAAGDFREDESDSARVTVEDEQMTLEEFLN